MCLCPVLLVDVSDTINTKIFAIQKNILRGISFVKVTKKFQRPPPKEIKSTTHGSYKKNLWPQRIPVKITKIPKKKREGNSFVNISGRMVFLFFLLGGGEGGVRGARKRAGVGFCENLRRGGVVCQEGGAAEGPEGVCGEFGGGGEYFLFGAKVDLFISTGLDVIVAMHSN